jgi:isoquinoline 1-oxidoreductase
VLWEADVYGAGEGGAAPCYEITCVQDMGVVVNPDGARAQIEGSIIMGLGSALTEEILFKDGAIGARNFDGYEIPRFSSLPQLDITLIDNPNSPASAGGEPGIIRVTAAIANAIADAIGGRLFELR